MRKSKALLFFGVLLLLLPALVWAADFGVIAEQRLGYGGVVDNDNGLDYIAVLLPRFSTLLGDNGIFHISAGFAARYEREEWAFAPELLRTELFWLFDFGTLRAGRIHYSDPLGFIADGLFDGAHFTFDTMIGSFSAGAWYTGLLYKRRANIAMTGNELLSLSTEIDYDNFGDTYFAPRRFVAALDWEHPSLFEGFLRTRFSILGQFDLTDEELHSQYLTAKFSLPVWAFTFDLGGSLGLMQLSGEQKLTFAAQFGAAWMVPTPFPSQLSLVGRYASGISEDGTTIDAFRPLTITRQSPILQPKIPGTSMILLDYSVRLNRSVLMSLSSYYFIRNDLYTYGGYLIDAEENNGHFLGNEFFARVFWSPVSDIHFNVGGGIFLPSMGNVTPRSENAWRVELGLTISLF
jgi:hypothetical protein